MYSPQQDEAFRLGIILESLILEYVLQRSTLVGWPLVFVLQGEPTRSPLEL